jgi:hypothetical protein
MSGELRYVNDRKKLEAQLGNSLERPSLLMQKQVYGKTQSDKESLNKGKAYLTRWDVEAQEKGKTNGMIRGRDPPMESSEPFQYQMR